MKNHSNRKRLAMATKDRTTGLCQAKENAKVSGLGLPQLSCSITDKVLPFSMMLFLLQPPCQCRPFTLQGRSCLSLHVACSLL